MAPENTDWHLRAHDAIEARIEGVEHKLEERFDDVVARLEAITTSLARRDGERAARRLTGSYVIPGAVSLGVAYLVKKLGLL